MTAQPDSLARELLAAARTLTEHPGRGTQGLWPRAAVFLARQALEVALKTFWSLRAPGLEGCSQRAQFLCLGTWSANEDMARLAHQTWSALSRASHHHPYELTPTQEELAGYFDAVQSAIEVLEAKSGARQPR